MKRYKRACDGISVPDKIIEKTLNNKKAPAKKMITCAIAACVAAAIFCGIMLAPGKTSSAYALELAEYPEMPQYPDESNYINKLTGELSEQYYELYDEWSSVRRERRSAEGYMEGMDIYLEKTIAGFLSDAEGENKIYSPLNVYMALGMLAEITNGNSGQQILELLGCGDIEELRSQAKMLWNVHYSNDGATTTVLASSLWLDESASVTQEALEYVADTYYASSYQGETGSNKFNNALRDWLNEQTGGFMEEQIGEVELSKETILALATTIYFRAKWSSEFSESRTEEGVFYGASGDVKCDFMHQSPDCMYFWGENFTAVSKNFTNGEEMRFILPDKGVSVEELLNNEETMEFILSSLGDWENSKLLTVNMSVPKFDITSDVDLNEELKKLGVTDVFSSVDADFSPLTGNMEGVFLSKTSHSARVAIDEEGCTAAAFTVMTTDGAPPPNDEVDFVLDRPFIFVITGIDGLPLFVGVVNSPV